MKRKITTELAKYLKIYIPELDLRNYEINKEKNSDIEFLDFLEIYFRKGFKNGKIIPVKLWDLAYQKINSVPVIKKQLKFIEDIIYPIFFKNTNNYPEVMMSDEYLFDNSYCPIYCLENNLYGLKIYFYPEFDKNTTVHTYTSCKWNVKITLEDMSFDDEYGYFNNNLKEIIDSLKKFNTYDKEDNYFILEGEAKLELFFKKLKTRLDYTITSKSDIISCCPKIFENYLKILIENDYPISFNTFTKVYKLDNINLLNIKDCIENAFDKSLKVESSYHINNNLYPILSLSKVYFNNNDLNIRLAYNKYNDWLVIISSNKILEIDLNSYFDTSRAITKEDCKTDSDIIFDYSDFPKSFNEDKLNFSFLTKSYMKLYFTLNIIDDYLSKS